jgi:hypothetical protein
VFRVLSDRARDQGVERGRGGGVVVIQRFGGALNLNVHFDALVLDGVYASDEQRALTFHRTRGLTTLDVEEVLATVEPRIARQLRARGLGDGDLEVGGSDPWSDEAPVLAGLAAASVQGRATLGPRQGSRPRRLGEAVETGEARVPGACQARVNGFSLHAGLLVPADQRERLERVCRDALRPPVAIERLHLTEDGLVRLSLRQPWHDGTTDLVFTPMELLERLAVLVPRPRVNLLLYFGVLGARAAQRADIVWPGRAEVAGDTAADGDANGGITPSRGRGTQWAALMQRTFGLDLLACPRCGGRLRLMALIEEAAVIKRILEHLGLPAEIPAPRPARPPPAPEPFATPDEWADPSVFTPTC